MLLLFDIDGTLRRGATAAHTRGAARGAAEVHGVDAAELRGTIAPAGRTDGEIARVMLLDAGVSARGSTSAPTTCARRAAAIYAQLCPPTSPTGSLPGVAELLSWLAARDDVMLVAGDRQLRAGRAAEAPAGRDRPSLPGRAGRFGSDAEDRAALPPIARRRARLGRRPYPREQTIVIGDTPRDIACARADGVRCSRSQPGRSASDELGGR